MEVKIQDKQTIIKFKENFFFDISCAILKEEKKDLNFEISFLLVENEEMSELNLAYRGLDGPTDVLAFPMLEEGDAILPGIEVLLGDIVISTEKAALQAEEEGHSVLKEIVILTIHGILHLLGYDHMNTDDKKEMNAKEDYYLKKILSFPGIEM